MGKKTRKTRWRTLSINGHQSDSESQNGDNTKSYYGKHHPRSVAPWYQNGTTPNSKYNSTHSTPTRRHNYYNSKYESSKSTRSNSTASENKMTFNEDEYTRITTPRQDVLFKKGYLSKPKPYLQQLNQQTRVTAPPTGTSTGNSTGDGTPDHQSADGAEGTDIEYEQSPFVYPNNYIDPNGIFFVNGGYDPYPQMVVYNPPICFTPYVNHRVKRYSTDSMTESTSPSVEAQDQYVEGNEMLGSGQDYNHVYGVVYPSYMYNGVVPTNDVPDTELHSTDPKRLKKKRRRRKLSKSKTPNEGDTSYTDEELSSEDETKSIQDLASSIKTHITTSTTIDRLETTSSTSEHEAITNIPNNTHTVIPTSNNTESPETTTAATNPDDQKSPCVESNEICDSKSDEANNGLQSNIEVSNEVILENCDDVKVENKIKYRVDAEEFIPRAYRHQHSFEPLHIPGFVPVSMYGPPPAFVQGPLPINFIPGIPQSPYGFITNQFFPENERFYLKHQESIHGNSPHICEHSQIDNCRKEIQETDAQTHTCIVEAENDDQQTDLIEYLHENSNEAVVEDLGESNKDLTDLDETSGENNEVKNISKLEEKDVSVENVSPAKKGIDIAKIVSKLEETTIEQTEIEAEIKICNKNTNKSIDSTVKVKNTCNTLTERSITATIDLISEEALTTLQNVAEKSKVIEKSTNKSQKSITLPKIDKPNNLKQRYTATVDVTKQKLIKNKSESTQPTSPKSVKSNTPLLELKPTKNPITILPKSSQPIEISKSVPVLPNYSEKLKAQHSKKIQISKSVCPRFERTRKTDNIDAKKLEIKAEPIKKYTEIKTIPVDQWISVSSKKKRKNKLNCETEMFNISENGVEDYAEDEFTNKIEEIVLKREEQDVSINKIDIKTENVIEYELINKANDNISTNIEKSEVKISEVVSKPIEILTKVVEIVTNPIEVLTKTSEVNKTKQGSNKQLTKDISTKKDKNKIKKAKKRIIITDEHIVQNEPIKTQPKKNEIKKPDSVCIEKIIGNKKETVEVKYKTSIIVNKVPEKVLTNVESNQINVTADILELEQKVESNKPKKKKKKSKLPKETTDNTSLNCSIDENYDFLSDNVSIPESDLKTNVEVSQELDRIIQRGLYANLEEKIKSVNPSDKFINSSSTDEFPFDLLKPPIDTSAKFGMLKNFNNFGMLFNNTTMNKTLEKAVINKMTTEQLATVNPKKNFDTNLSHVDLTTSNTTQNILPDKSREITPLPNDVITTPPLPITRAVKEWMYRTREHTPDVEIFKNPHEIKHDFALLSDSESSDTECLVEPEQKNADGNPLSVASVDVDDTGVAKSNACEPSLEFWNDDILTKNELKGEMKPERSGFIEEGEDALIVYESAYGTNADYMKIQKEIEEKQCENRLNYAKDGGLPYRAICCTVM